MGQKVNPNGMRLGINKDWDSKWYAPKSEFSKYLMEDVKIREYLDKTLARTLVLNNILQKRNFQNNGNYYILCWKVVI